MVLTLATAHPILTTAAPYCSRLAWDDDRLNPGLNPQHIYTQYVCTDGFKLFTNDLRVDTAATNATNPAIVFQTNFDFAVAWQADRGDGSGKHDIYARFYYAFGVAKGPPFKVNTSSSDATLPAMAYDSSSSNVFIAWQEFDPSAGNIRLSKFTKDGALVGSVNGSVNTTHDATLRTDTQLAVDGGGTVIATWTDARSPETIYRRRFSNALGDLEAQQLQVDDPSPVPIGADVAVRPTIAIDASNNFVIAWQGSMNDFTQDTWNGFARSFDASGATKKNDFRVDIAPRGAAARSPRVARVLQAKRFAYFWRDNRAGGVHYDAYTRVVQSLP
jgi:hypothetical protein